MSSSQIPISQRNNNSNSSQGATPAPLLPLAGLRIFMQIRPMPVMRTPGGGAETIARIPSICSNLLIGRETAAAASTSSPSPGGGRSVAGGGSATCSSNNIIVVDDELSVHGDRVKHNAKKDIFRLGGQLVLSENSADIVVFYNGSNSLLENILTARRIPVVSPAWLYACRQASTRLPTADYELTLVNSRSVSHTPPSSALIKPQLQSSTSSVIFNTNSTPLLPTATGLVATRTGGVDRLLDDEFAEDDRCKNNLSDNDYKLALKFALHESQSQQLLSEEPDASGDGYYGYEEGIEMDEEDETPEETDDDDDPLSGKRKGGSKKGPSGASKGKVKLVKKENKKPKREKKVKDDDDDPLRIPPRPPLPTKVKPPPVNRGPFRLFGSPLDRINLSFSMDEKDKTMKIEKYKTNTTSSYSNVTSSSLNQQPPLLFNAPFLNSEEDSQPHVIAWLVAEEEERKNRAAAKKRNNSSSQSTSSGGDLVQAIVNATKQRHRQNATVVVPSDEPGDSSFTKERTAKVNNESYDQAAVGAVGGIDVGVDADSGDHVATVMHHQQPPPHPCGGSSSPSGVQMTQRLDESACPFPKVVDGHKITSSSVDDLLASTSSSLHPTPISSQLLRSDILFSKAIVEAQRRQQENAERIDREAEEARLSANKRRRDGGGGSKSVTPTLQRPPLLEGKFPFVDVEDSNNIIEPRQLFSAEEQTVGEGSAALLSSSSPARGAKRPRSESPAARRKIAIVKPSMVPQPGPTARRLPIPVSFVCPAPTLCSVSGVGDARVTVQSILEFMGCELASKVFGKRTTIKPSHMVLVGAQEETTRDHRHQGEVSPSSFTGANYCHGSEEAVVGSNDTVTYADTASILQRMYTSFTAANSLNTLTGRMEKSGAGVNRSQYITPEQLSEPDAFFTSYPLANGAARHPIAHVVQFLVEATLLSSSSSSSSPTPARCLPHSVVSVVSSRVMLALACGMPLLTQKWVFACMDIAPQAAATHHAAAVSRSAQSPTAANVQSRHPKSKRRDGRGGKDDKSSKIKSEKKSHENEAMAASFPTIVPKYQLVGQDVETVMKHGTSFDGITLCEDWSCSCCSDMGPDDDDDMDSVCSVDDVMPPWMRGGGPRSSLKKVSIQRNSFLTYYGYPPPSLFFSLEEGDCSKRGYCRSKDGLAGESDIQLSDITELASALQSMLGGERYAAPSSSSSSVSPFAVSNKPTLADTVLMKFGMLLLLPVEHATYVHPSHVPLADIVTVCVDHNRVIRERIVANFFTSSSNDSAGRQLLSSCLTTRDLWSSMCCALPSSWNLPDQLRRLPSISSKMDYSNIGDIHGILSHTVHLLRSHSFLTEAVYTAVRITYLRTLFKGMTFLLLGHHDKPKNSDVVELMEMLGGTTTRNAQSPHITAVVQMDDGAALHEMVMLIRRKAGGISPIGSGHQLGGSSTKKGGRSPTSATGPTGTSLPTSTASVAAAEVISVEEKLLAFQDAFPHAPLFLSIRWILDCILHQRLAPIDPPPGGSSSSSPVSTYAVLNIPRVCLSMESSGSNVVVKAEKEEEEDSSPEMINTAIAGGGFSMTSSVALQQAIVNDDIDMRTPLTTLQAPQTGFSPVPHRDMNTTSPPRHNNGHAMAEEEQSGDVPTPMRSGGGRLSSGSKKIRRGPQSAVKDPDLQLSTQQLLLPSQASLRPSSGTAGQY